MTAPIVLIEGFEHQSHSFFYEVTDTVNTTFPTGRLGGNCLRVNSSYASMLIPGTESEVCIGFAVKGEKYASSTLPYFLINDTGGSNLLALGVSTVRGTTTHWTGGTSGLVSDWTTFVPAGNWAYVEVKFKYASSGYITIRVNGGQVFSYTGNTLRTNASTGVISEMQFQGQDVVSNFFNFDDIWVERGANADFRGSRKVVRLLPDGDSTTNWSFATGGGAHYSQVNSATNTATYISTVQGSGAVDSFNIQNPGTTISSVENVQVDALAARSSVTPGNIALRSNAVVGTVKPVPTEADSFSPIRQVFSTPADLNAATIGVVASA